MLLHGDVGRHEKVKVFFQIFARNQQLSQIDIRNKKIEDFSKQRHPAMLATCLTVKRKPVLTLL